MKKIVISLVVFLKIVSVFGQSIAQDSVNYYIDNLGWNSLFIKPTYATELVLNREAAKLVSFKNNQTVQKLFDELSNENKTVAIHMIFTKMFESKSANFAKKYIYAKDSIVAVEYCYNTLSWTSHIKESKYTIEPSAILAIKEYWRKRLSIYFKNINV